MRVSGEEYLRVAQMRQIRPVTEAPLGAAGHTASAPTGNAAARVEFSSDARDIQRIKTRAASEPDVREDVVASLRERIQSGTYSVSGQQIGEMMMRRVVADHTA